MDISYLVRPEYFKDHEKALSKQTSKIGKSNYPSDIKLALYRQGKYRQRLLKEKGQEVRVRQKGPSKVVSSVETQSGNNPIITSLPKSLQSKGENLVSFLTAIPELTINHKGEVGYGQQHVKGSRIVDLVHDFTRERVSASPPKGWELLAKALGDHNVPREFVGNRTRWNYIQSLDRSRSPSVTPKRPSITKTLSDLDSVRRQLQFQSGNGGGGIRKALKRLKWKTH